MRIRFEYWLLVSFLLGLFIAYTAPFKIELFPIVVNGFVSGFMFLAPIVVLIIIFNSTCSLISEKDVAGSVIEASVVLFASLALCCSLFASIILSLLLPTSGGSASLSTRTLSYILNIMASSLARPVTLALVLGVASAYAFSRTSSFRGVVALSRQVYELQERCFKALLLIFPVIALSLGGSLYYNLGQISLEVYVVSMGLTLLLGLTALATLFTFTQRIAHAELRKMTRYSANMFAVGLSVGSSYLALPLALKIFKEQFNVDASVGDLVLSLGASLNRCGSVMGVLVVTFITARYVGIEFSWQQMLLLAIPIALIGFGSPGIQGGTLLVGMPVILHVIAPTDTAKFMAIAVALFVGGTTFIQAAVNNVASGYVALLVNRHLSKQTVKPSNQKQIHPTNP